MISTPLPEHHTMSDSPNFWTLEGFVEHFGFFHEKMHDHKFVWVLGAGASYASGIPLGSTLVDQWLEQIHRKEDKEKRTLQEWATEENLGIAKFEYDKRASFYPKIYQRCFRDYPEEGFAYLEDLMSGKDPSPGYSILASALAEDPPRHNVVITTNFDNLVADALSIYTDTFPFVCGHESLTEFVRIAMRRPLVCKIHRDILLAPQNDPRSLKRLHDAWGSALRGLFEHYTPLFIGYGGNDDTLMDLLESLQPGDIKGQLIWCYYKNSKPSDRIIDLVTDHQGALVPVPDFDLLMVLLGEKMNILLQDEEIERRAAQRTQRYRDRVQRLDSVTHPAVANALAATFNRSGGWWAWEQKAKLEKDPERRETVYRQGLEAHPKSAELRYTLANFLINERRRFDEVEQLYREALQLSPRDGLIMGALAAVLHEIHHKHTEAENLYCKASKLAPNNVDNLTNYAEFLYFVRGKYTEADRLYQKAIELAPKDASIVARYAEFFLYKGQLDESISQLRQAKALGSKDDTMLIALIEAVLASARGDDATPSLKVLHRGLSTGEAFGYYGFSASLGCIHKRLAPKEQEVYTAIIKAIDDPAEVDTALSLIDERLKSSDGKKPTPNRAPHKIKKSAKRSPKKLSTPKKSRKKSS